MYVYMLYIDIHLTEWTNDDPPIWVNHDGTCAWETLHGSDWLSLFSRVASNKNHRPCGCPKKVELPMGQDRAKE